MGPHNSVEGLHSISTNLGATATQIRNEAGTTVMMPSGRRLRISGEIGLWHTLPTEGPAWPTPPCPASMRHTLGCRDIPRCMPATYRGKPGPNDRGLLRCLTGGHLGMPHPVVSTAIHWYAPLTSRQTTLEAGPHCAPNFFHTDLGGLESHDALNSFTTNNFTLTKQSIFSNGIRIRVEI